LTLQQYATSAQKPLKTINTMIKLLELTLQTLNRGTRSFIVSHNTKGYYAHELGEQTTWSQVTGKPELRAHRLNPTRRHGNQYGTWLKPKPFKYIIQAKAAAHKQAQTWISYH
jgi:predicted esterase YcpF (UPF0227 family)